MYPVTSKKSPAEVDVPEPLRDFLENEDITVLTGLPAPQYFQLLGYLDGQYHNGVSLLEDDIYDLLRETYEKKHGVYNKIGSAPSGLKVDLPYFLGSLDKVKEQGEIDNWKKNFPGSYLVEDKIDGLTLLLVAMKGKTPKLYTRGGGSRGMDVSHLVPYLKLPPLTDNLAIRGEVVMSKENFLKVGKEFKNPRNRVSGIVNSTKNWDPELAEKLQFYAYRVMNGDNLSPKQQMAYLEKKGFLTPNPIIFKNLLVGDLTSWLEKRKEKAPYEIDGLVIYQDKIEKYPLEGNPSHVIAFKAPTSSAVTEVTAVTWGASKDRRLKPVVHFNVINLSGADLNKASGYNARFIMSNNIGPGAKILVTRSGDVIPKILEVLEPGNNSWEPPGKWEWDKNQVEIILLEDNDQVIVNKLRHFLECLDVKNVGPSRVKSIVDHGIDSISRLILTTPEEFGEIPGIGPEISKNLYNDIRRKITGVPLERIMDASGIFSNVGEKRFRTILEVYPDLLSIPDPENTLRSVKGINNLAVDISEKIPAFLTFLQENPLISIETPKISSNLPVLVPETNTPPVFEFIRKLQGMTVVFSGFRDTDLETRIRSGGGKVSSAISGNTSILVMKDVSDIKGKAAEAIKRNIPRISRDEFIGSYL